LTNAIDALEEKGQSLTSAELVDRPSQITIQTRLLNQNLEITIADNAQGMPPEVINKIFDPFYTTKEIGKGTGLGLAISYQIVVERHQGKLACYSQLGQGTRFVITIPTKTAKGYQ